MKLVVRKSTDGGGTWPSTHIIPNTGIPDKNHMSVDITSSPYRNRIYVAYTEFQANPKPIKLSRSTSIPQQGYLEFLEPVNISQGASGNYKAQGVNLAVGPNGEVYAIWAIYDTPTQEVALGFNKSLDGGVTWQSGTRLSLPVVGIRGFWNHKNPAVPPQPIRVHSFPSMAVDRSGGSMNGTLYVVWANKGDGTDKADIHFSKSTDGGLNWVTPKKVNTDNTTTDQWFPWISVDPYGLINIVYYSSEGDANNQLTGTYVAQSSDGGQTFSSFMVSDITFTPYPIPFTAPGYMGDYIGIASKAGKAYVSWMDNRNEGKYQVYMDTINSELPDWKLYGAPSNLTITSGAYSNPVLNWNANTSNNFTTGYKVYRNGGLIGTITNKNTKTFTDYDVAMGSGVPLTYTVKAYYATNLTNPSNAVTINGSFMKAESQNPLTFTLIGNNPNPFNPTTRIQYEIPFEDYVQLTIYDILGREVKTLISYSQTAGLHEVLWDGTDNLGRRVSSGVYVYKLESGSYVQTKKMLLLK